MDIEPNLTPHFNKTFNAGKAPYQLLNACVGTNGFPDRRSYLVGFAEAVELLTKLVVDNSEGTIDALIYPICFCARHQLELFVKEQIETISPLRGIHPTIKLTSTHDIGELWGELRRIAGETDERFVSYCGAMDEFVADFADMDPTGETFRYPDNPDTGRHLVNTPVINLMVFRDRFIALRSAMEDFESASDAITDEYQRKSPDSKLSRAVLEQIATLLPQRDQWQTEALTEAKALIMERFNLSSRALQAALILIQKHPKFCTHIGMTKELRGVSRAAIERLDCLYNGELTLADVPSEEVAAMDAIRQVAMDSHYPEDFDSLLDANMEIFNLPHYQNLIVPRMARSIQTTLRKGMLKMGQVDLAEHMITLARKRLPENAITEAAAGDDVS